MKGTCRISRAVFVFSILYAFSAFSEVFLWNNGSTDFNSPQSYKTQNGAIATRLPTSDDAIGFKEVSLEIQSGSEAMSALNSVKYIQLDNNAQITFNCTEDVTLNCGIFTLTGVESAKVIKRGAGTLLLAAKGKAPGYNNSIYGDAYADFSVEEGILKFYQGDDLAKDMRSRNVAISKGAVCYLPIRKKFQIANLYGDGLLTNDWNLANGVNLGLYGSAGSFWRDSAYRGCLCA